MSKKSNSAAVYKKVISIILSFFVFIFLTVITLLACIYLNLFEPHTVLDALRKSGYYSGALAQFEENAWDITIPLGLPETVVQGLVTSDQIEADIDAGVRAALNNNPVTPDLTSIQTLVTERVESYFSDKGQTLSESQKAVLEQYKTSLCNEYLNRVSIPLLDYCGNIKAAYSKVIFTALGVLGAMLLGSVILLIAIHRHRHRGIRYFVYSTLATAMAVALLPLVSFATGFHRKISISPKYLKGFVVNYIDTVFLYLLLSALFFVLISALLLVVIGLIRKQYIAANKERKREQTAQRPVNSTHRSQMFKWKEGVQFTPAGEDIVGPKTEDSTPKERARRYREEPEMRHGPK